MANTFREPEAVSEGYAHTRGNIVVRGGNVGGEAGYRADGSLRNAVAGRNIRERTGM
jgi:hypothetical protein